MEKSRCESINNGLDRKEDEGVLRMAGNQAGPINWANVQHQE